jgi:putative DNA primase/helicase
MPMVGIIKPVRDADLHSDPKTLAATLARHGLWIAPQHRSLLVAYFNDLKVDERVTFVARTGWHTIGDRRVFVLPHETFGADELVLLNTDVASPYGYNGSLKDWQDSVGRLTIGQRLAILSLSTAFAGPLLDSSGKMVVASTSAEIHQPGKHQSGARVHRCGGRVRL